jgi:hypothetical protein
MIVGLQAIVKHEVLYFAAGQIIRHNVDVTVSHSTTGTTGVGHGTREKLSPRPVDNDAFVHVPRPGPVSIERDQFACDLINLLRIECGGYCKKAQKVQNARA